MSYCTVEDVVHEFTPTLKRQMEHDYGDDFETIIARHIEKAEAFINASLSRAYSVPLKSATTVVISAECKIAAYFSAIAYSEKDAVVKDKYETATMMLDYLVEANNPALVDDGLTEDEADTAGTLYGSDSQVFTAEELSNW